MTRVRLCCVVVCLACTQAPPCDVCAGACVDLQHDTQHCGSCEKSCAPGSRCESGQCKATCAGDECDGVCVDLKIDPLHCGACDITCAPPHSTGVCLDGGCARLGCEPGWFDCDFDDSNGCESRLPNCDVEVCPPVDGGAAPVCSLLGMSDDAARLLVRSGGYMSGESWQFFLYEVGDAGVRQVVASVVPDGGYFSSTATLSGDGRTVLLATDAPLVVSDTDGLQDVYLYDVPTASATRVTELWTDAGWFLPYGLALSRDGRYAASDGSFWTDLKTGARSLELYGGFPFALSPDGLSLAYQDFEVQQMAIRDERDGGRRHLSFDGGGGFGTYATAFAFARASDAYVVSYNNAWGILPSASTLSFDGRDPQLSGDGRVMAYQRINEDTGDSHCEVVDVVTGQLWRTRATQPTYGTSGISADARTVVVYTYGGLALIQMAPPQ